MGKPITGKSFGGCVRYVVEKPQAKVLATEGVRNGSANAMIQDFNLGRKLRPELGKAVGHLVLSWHQADAAKLSDAVMLARAKEYMQKMGIGNTQYVVVRHSDRAHPHLHLIYNRVDYSGKTVSDQNNFAKNIRACREITEKYGYHLGEGKGKVNREALRGKEKVRYELYDAIKAELKTARSWKTLEAGLLNKGISIHHKLKSGTSEVQGISFEKDGIKLKGSAIDRSLSYGAINAQLVRIGQGQQLHSSKSGVPSVQQSSSKENVQHSAREDEHQQKDHHSLFSSQGQGLLHTLLEGSRDLSGPAGADDGEAARRKRKKHEAEQAQSQGISR